MILRNPAQLKPLERVIEGPFGSVALRARRPTVREAIESEAAPSPADRIAVRLKIFVGWEGVLDEAEKPVPFTEAAFIQACEQLPDLLWKAVAFAADVFLDGGGDSKNSDAPPQSGSAAAPASTHESPDGHG